MNCSECFNKDSIYSFYIPGIFLILFKRQEEQNYSYSVVSLYVHWSFGVKEARPICKSYEFYIHII